MPERRQAFKREPIEVELSKDRIISVAPIPWEQRNDFGDEVIKQHVDIFNEAVKVYIDDESGAPQLAAKLAEKFSDPTTLLRIGLGPETYALATTEPLYVNQIVEILLAICEVNDLRQLIPLLDPNSPAPTDLSGMLSGLNGAAAITPETESGPDSSSTDSEETPSESSLTQNSSESSSD